MVSDCWGQGAEALAGSVESGKMDGQWLDGLKVERQRGDFEPIRGGVKQTDQSQGSPSPGAVFVLQGRLRLEMKIFSKPSSRRRSLTLAFINRFFWV